MIRVRAATLLPFVLVPLLLAAACDGGFSSPDEGEAPIDEETFIQTYADLRLTARELGGLPEEDRERILDEHGVSVEDLRAFIDVHATNVPYMQGVWNEVDRRIAESAQEEEGPDADAPGMDIPRGGPGAPANDPGS